MVTKRESVRVSGVLEHVVMKPKSVSKEAGEGIMEVATVACLTSRSKGERWTNQSSLERLHCDALR